VVARCLNCNQPLPEEGPRPGRPKLYCDKYCRHQKNSRDWANSVRGKQTKREYYLRVTKPARLTGGG
jgi:hypothetical protein